MSADVEEERIYTAHCTTCKWYGMGWDLRSYAEEEAERHDREHHGGDAD